MLRESRAIRVEDRPQLLANPIIDGRTAQILSLRVGQKLEAGQEELCLRRSGTLILSK
jgi:hypothetical protein